MKRVTAVAALLLLVGMTFWAAAVGAQSVTRFGVVSVIRMIVANDITAADITVSDDATVTDLATVGDLTTTDDLSVADDGSVGDDLTVTGDLTISPGVTETIGYDEQIDPVASYHRITASAARGTDDIATGTAGDVLALINVGSNTITLTDTGTLKLSGNAALGAGDTIILLSDGTNWIQMAPEGDN